MFRRTSWFLALILCLYGCSGEPTPTPTPSPHADTHDHEAEAHESHSEGEVELKPAQIEMAGIVVQKVNYRDFTPTLKLPATIVGDPDGEVHVSVRADGIVENLYARVGDTVQSGRHLATVDSPELAKLRSEYQLQKKETELAQSNLQRRLQLSRLGDTSRRPYEEAQKELAGARMSLQAAQAGLDLSRSKLSRLTDLLKDGIASSQQVEEARANFREATARLGQASLEIEVAQTHFQRESRLRRSGVHSDNEAFQAQAELQRNQQAEQSSREVLASFGAVPDLSGGRVDLFSPIRGVVIARQKAVGEHVTSGDSLFTVLDASRVWAWVDLSERNVPEVRSGSHADVIVPGFEQHHFEGKITFVTPQADPDTKKIRARLELDNASGRLRPNMFAEVLIAVGSHRKALAIPDGAVVLVENRNVVYVQKEPGHYQRHPVETGLKSSGWVEIRKGLQPGESVVTQGTLSLQAEDLKASMGEEGHEH